MKQKKESTLKQLQKHTTKITALLTMLCTLLAVTLSSCGGEPQVTGVCDNCRQTKPLYEVKISGTGLASFLSGTFDFCNDCTKKVTADAEAQASSLGVKLSITTKKKTTPQKESLSGALSSAFALPAKTKTVEEAAEAAEAEEVKEAAPEADISTKDNVLFDQDGVRFLFDGLRMVNDPKKMAYFDFTLENNNPDYKHATVEMQSISFNELEPDGIMYIFDILGEWSHVEAGQTLSTSTQNGYEMDRYDRSVLSALGVSSAEFPIETIGFAFKVQIGSGGEEEWHFVTLETENYNGKSYRKYFGEKAASYDGTYSMTGEPYTLDIYARVDDLGTAVVLLPAEGSEERFQTQMSIKLGANGKEMSSAMKDQSFEKTTLSDSYLFYPTGGTILRCAKTEEELRRSMEIGPNEALEVQLLGYYFDGGALTLFTK